MRNLWRELQYWSFHTIYKKTIEERDHSSTSNTNIPLHPSFNIIIFIQQEATPILLHQILNILYLQILFQMYLVYQSRITEFVHVLAQEPSCVPVQDPEVCYVPRRSLYPYTLVMHSGNSSQLGARSFSLFKGFLRHQIPVSLYSFPLLSLSILSRLP